MCYENVDWPVQVNCSANQKAEFKSHDNKQEEEGGHFAMQHNAEKYPFHKKQPISLHFPDFIENVLEKKTSFINSVMSTNLPDFLTYAYLL